MARQIINLPFRTLKGSVTTPTGPDDAASDGVAGHTAGNTFNSDPDNPNTGTFYLQTPSARGDGAIQLDFGGGVWEPWDGPNINSKNPWTIYNDGPFTVENSNLIYDYTPSAYFLTNISCYSDDDDIPLTDRLNLSIKIQAEVHNDRIPGSPSSNIQLNVFEVTNPAKEEAAQLDLWIVQNAGLTSADTYCDDDNFCELVYDNGKTFNGAININLEDYHFEYGVSGLYLSVANGSPDHRVSLSCDYINFS